MKSFFKLVTANIVAILIFMALLVLSFIFLIVISSISGQKTTPIKDNSVLTINLEKGIIESPSEIQLSIFELDAPKAITLSQAIKAIAYAKTDDRIKGISIETDYVSAGLTQLDNLRQAIKDFKESGKFVYAYGNTMTQGAYYLATVADKEYLNPTGFIELKGMASEVVYLKDFLDKYGIGVEVLRHGKYKAAVEPFLTDKISEENKTQLTTMLGDLWGNISDKIKKSRAIDSLSFRSSVDSLVGGIADLALKNNLVDELAQKSQYHNMLKTKLGIEKDKDLNSISLEDYISGVEWKNQGDKNKEIAILIASGQIYSGEGYDGIYSENLIKEIKKLKDDEDVKAVVLRVNSPGGSAGASDEILYELQQLNQEKPLVVSMGDYAASGGYYISMAGQKIFAEPNTITGSIGVFGIIPNIKNLAANNGIKSYIVETNENSVIHSPIHGLSSGGKRMLQRSIEQTYKRFVHFVSKNRSMSFEEVDAVGGGHVWSGTRAKKLGLVDELGSLNDAIKTAAKLAKVENYSTKSYPKAESPMQMLLHNLNKNNMTAELLKAQFGEDTYQLFEHISNINKQGEVQMKMPYLISLN